MNYHENEQKLVKTQKKLLVDCDSLIYLMTEVNIQDGGMHNAFALNKARSCISKIILIICKRF